MNKHNNIILFNCILVCSTCFFSACTEYTSTPHSTKQAIDTTTKNQNTSTAEYIIVLRENVDIETALNSLKQYDVEVIRDLKRQRYLIKLNNGPSIKHLQKHISTTRYIKHIQLNAIYKTQ